MTNAVKKHAGGRPTKHTEQLLEKAREYLSVYEDNGEVVPSIVGLALHCGISKNCVYDWAKDPNKKQFYDIARRVEHVQELKLASGGLSNLYNANITKLLLSKHGYSDRIEQDVKSSDGSMSPVSDAAIQLAKDKILKSLNQE